MAVTCSHPRCSTCHPPKAIQTTTITMHETGEGKLPKPDPATVKGVKNYVDCVDWQCADCIPEANITKFGNQIMDGLGA